jgi:serine/threonine protein kinase/Tfp pilus assembly protein PilF
VAIKCPACQFENPDETVYCGKCAAPLKPSDDVFLSATKTLQVSTKELTRGSTLAERYEIIEELGKGGMGRVYRVVDKKIDEEVALKILNPEISTNKKTIARFQNELKLARKIAHRNVCHMYHLGEEEGTSYITMEYVPGEDLKSFLRRSGQLSVAKTISIAKQVCEGLAEAHRLGVVHRDLKPQNIMIDKEGNAKIMDFGIARSLEGKGVTGEGVVIGTPDYMSPEQVDGKGVDQRSDIYAMGVILYEMATGRVPFEGETPFSVAVKHKTETPSDPRKLNTQIPDDLSTVILKCLEKDREKRYQSTEELLPELTRIEEGIPTTERIIAKRRPFTSKEVSVQFKVKKLLVPAFVVMALVITALVLWRVIPREQAMMAPKIENSIAVVSFENMTGDKSLDHFRKVIPNLFIVNLENTGYIHVVTVERMYDLLKQMNKEDVEIIDRELGFELCAREGIESLVLGEFSKFGNTYSTTVKVVDVETRKTLKSATSKGEGEDNIINQQIDELTRAVIQGMGIAREKVEATPLNIAEFTTSSLEAYEYYANGMELRIKGKHEEARQSFEKALEIDPSYAMVYYGLSRIYWATDNPDLNREALKKAMELSEKSSEKDRLYIEGYYAKMIEGNQEKANAILTELVRKYPREKDALIQLAWDYYQKRRFEEAEKIYRRVLDLDPSYYHGLQNLSHIYAVQKKYEMALELIEKLNESHPNELNVYWLWGDIYKAQSNLDEATKIYEKALSVNPEWLVFYWHIGLIHAYREDYNEALKWIDKLISRAQGNDQVNGYIVRAFIKFWLGRFDQCLVDLDTAEDSANKVNSFYWPYHHIELIRFHVFLDKKEFDKSLQSLKNWLDMQKKCFPDLSEERRAVNLILITVLDLKQNRTKSVETNLEEVRSIKAWMPDAQRYFHYYHEYLSAEVSLVNNSPEEAVTLFKKLGISENLDADILNEFFTPVSQNRMPFLHDGLARAYQQIGELDEAITEYERLLSLTPRDGHLFIIHPLYHYRLGKLYEQKGSKGKAIDEYEKFLDLWRDADPALTDVHDARKRLAALNSE